MADGMAVIGWLAREKKLFRERDVRAQKASTGCLEDAHFWGIAKPHGHGVWSHPGYVPTRYEILQIRFESAVFWGPSALWLHGAVQEEPEELWIAIGNRSRPPRTLDLSTIVIRTRNLESDVVTLRSPGRVQQLRVHSVERATRDAANSNCPSLIARALERREFLPAPEGDFLSGHTRPWLGWTSPTAPPKNFEERENWSVTRSLPHHA